MQKQQQNTRYRQVIILGVLVLLFGWILMQGGDPEVSEEEHETLTIEHGHGLAVDVADPDRVFLATHHGLFAMDQGGISRVGATEHDFMGFTAHPDDPERFYSSGHPLGGGNLGVLQSSDGGVTWEKLSGGVGGPVDFHTMTISPANPEMLWGWYGRSIQRSVDGGRTWERLDAALPEVLQFVPHPTQEDELYAVTLRGIMRSTDAGETWSGAISAFSGADGITMLAIDPEDTDRFYVYTRTGGFQFSEDSGATWQGVDEGFGGEFPIHISVSRADPSVIYVYTHKNSLYRSSDRGLTWVPLLLGGQPV